MPIAIWWPSSRPPTFKDAGRIYLEQYLPDLYIGFDHDDEIDDWKAHPVPWTDTDIKKRIIE